MMRIALAVWCACFACGCASQRQYIVTLRTGQEIFASTRPKLEKATATYRFKNAEGTETTIPAFAIKEIEIRE